MMRAFAHKQNLPQRAMSSSPARAFDMATRGQAHDEHAIPSLRRTAVRPMLQTNGARTPNPDYDFSRIPIHRPAGGVVQTKLAVFAPGDEYEQEADDISRQVMQMPEPPLQRACAQDGESTKSRTEQTAHGYERLHTKRVGTGGWGQIKVPPIVGEVLGSPGHPLDPDTRAFMEPRFGHNFSDVRVHADVQAAESARAVGALAYTVGRDVVFGHGHNSQDTAARRHLLAHELAHVVQQNGSAVSLQRKDAESEEREKWQKALKGKSLPTARRIVDEKDTPFFVEGLIETSKVLAPYLQGKLSKTSVAKNFNVYGSREEFDAKASKLVGAESPPGTKFGGFFHRATDSIHLPPRAAFGHALHEGIHKYSAAVVLGAFGQFLNEGITQYFADQVQAEHKVEGEAPNEYGQQLECAKIVPGLLKERDKTLGEAYFRGNANQMRQDIETQLGIDTKERIELAQSSKLCERIKQKGR